MGGPSTLNQPTRQITGPTDGRSLAELFRTSLGRERRTSLLIYHRGGAELVPLRPDVGVVVGRTSEADVVVSESGLSRRHARFELRGQSIIVEDLGSTNGVFVNGERVDQAEVGPLDQVALGSLPVVINTLDPLEEGLYGLESHERFRIHLDEEIARCRLFGRSLALLLVGAQPGRGGATAPPLNLWCPDVRRLLRPFDHAGLYSSSRVELVLAESSSEQADELARRIISSGDAAGATLRCGIALYPDSGTTPDALFEVAADAFHQTSQQEPVRRADTLGSRSLPPKASTGDADADLPVLLSPSMKEAYDIIARVAPRPLPVLIRGETGTGKELAAQAIHRRSPRADKPLGCVNCGALPAQLVESTLFGHEKGAFTGAYQRRLGVFETANGGTVLLDEIGELPPEAQASLLRVLETKRFCRVGSATEIEVDVRVLAATHCDLEAMARHGGFREDLLFRLNVITIDLPPLRERREEIAPLVQFFIEQANVANDCAIEGITAAAIEALLSHDWPGNIRELRNVIERGVVIARGSQITMDDLPGPIRQTAPTRAQPIADEDQGPTDLKSRVQRYETQVVRQVLTETGGNREAAAERLGISLRTLAYKMRLGGIRTQDIKGR